MSWWSWFLLGATAMGLWVVCGIAVGVRVGARFKRRAS